MLPVKGTPHHLILIYYWEIYANAWVGRIQINKRSRCLFLRSILTAVTSLLMSCHSIVIIVFLGFGVYRPFFRLPTRHVISQIASWHHLSSICFIVTCCVTTNDLGQVKYVIFFFHRLHFITRDRYYEKNEIDKEIRSIWGFLVRNILKFILYLLYSVAAEC